MKNNHPFVSGLRTGLRNKVTTLATQEGIIDPGVKTYRTPQKIVSYDTALHKYIFFKRYK